MKENETESCSVVSDCCNPMDYKVHGILQARILEWVACPFSRGFSQPRDWTQVLRTAVGFFTSWATREAQEDEVGQIKNTVRQLRPDPGLSFDAVSSEGRKHILLSRFQ